MSRGFGEEAGRRYCAEGGLRRINASRTGWSWLHLFVIAGSVDQWSLT